MTRGHRGGQEDNKFNYSLSLLSTQSCEIAFEAQRGHVWSVDSLSESQFS